MLYNVYLARKLQEDAPSILQIRTEVSQSCQTFTQRHVSTSEAFCFTSSLLSMGSSTISVSEKGLLWLLLPLADSYKGPEKQKHSALTQ